MATQKLFLSEIVKKKRRLGNSISTTYEYDGEMLYIYWKTKFRAVNAQLGDAFYIKCNGNFPEISKLEIPNNNHKLILWLCGYYSRNSATNVNRFHEITEKMRKQLDKGFYDEVAVNTEEYSFIICNNQRNERLNVAGYIDESVRLTPNKVIEILNAYYDINITNMPVDFIKAHLKKRFCLDDADLSKIYFG